MQECYRYLTQSCNTLLLLYHSDLMQDYNTRLYSTLLLISSMTDVIPVLVFPKYLFGTSEPLYG